jgi:tetratricopeptide (TPR) repeat protein
MRAYQRGDLTAAAEGFRAAANAYAQAGDEAAAAEAANNLCVALLQADRPQEALACVQDTPAVFERFNDPARAAQAHGNAGSALEGCGRLAEAEACYLRSRNGFREVGDREAEALILQRLSHVRLRQGQPLDALAAMQSSLDVAPRGGLVRRWTRQLLTLPLRLFSK